VRPQFRALFRVSSVANENLGRRIRSLEAHVAHISQSQTSIHQCLAEIVNHMRTGGLSVR
jgi:hypothetical protein